MKVNGENYQTIWANYEVANKKFRVFMINQSQDALPFKFKIFEAKNYLEGCRAIKEMIVSGAGLIGATAGYTMAQASIEAPEDDFWSYMEEARENIELTRPTARNLFYATDRVWNAMAKSPYPRFSAMLESKLIADEDAENCRRIGVHGNRIIKDGMTIQTHCNAGWLAFVDWGSATSPIYTAHREGKNIEVYVDVTMPKGQGARLTAWELANEGVSHFIIPDNAGAYYMSQGKIDMMIVGADRIAANGDAANKIGTLEKAICAKYYGIPFYVAAPTTTFDLNCKRGEDIPIEERNSDEVKYKTGPTKDGNIETILVASPKSKAKNPAFDVTPAELINGIITEKGIIRPYKEDIEKLFS